MNELADSQSTLILLLLMVTFLVVAVIEAYRPIIEQERLFTRWRINFSLFVINTGLIQSLTVIIGIVAATNIGLTPELTVQSRGWLIVIASILLLDLTSYLTHRVFHVVPLLWSLHATHHSDDATDLTTGWRFHPMEAIIFTMVRVAVVLALGIPPVALLIFEVLVFQQNLLVHANLRISKRLQRFSSLVFITPWDHRVHHGIDPTTYNSNFGTLFSFWDRIFRTRRSSLELQDSLPSTGISGLAADESNTLLGLLFMPKRIWRQSARAQSIDQTKHM